MKIVVYTSVHGTRDPHRDDILCLSEYNRFKSPALNARIAKCLPHLFLPSDTDWSIWVDGNIFLKVSPEELVSMVGLFHDVGVWGHPWNNTVWEEAHQVMRRRLDHKWRVLLGDPKSDRNKLAMTGIVIRKHSYPVSISNQRWWSYVSAHSHRDQLSFPKSFSNQSVNYFDKLDSIDDNEFFKRVPHSGR